MMEHFVGLDVSLRSRALCVVDPKGNVVRERELACEVNDIAACLSDFEFLIERIALEAGTMSRHLNFGLQAAGFDVVCLEARQLNPALSAMRNKTDKNDARGIAHILRTGWFSPLHMKSREAHGLRALHSTRKPSALGRQLSNTTPTDRRLPRSHPLRRLSAGTGFCKVS
ncbi:transposase [Pseudophaeobacter sp.]|uniref:IS110 family transposase n=1 Tax=Pseudophaeobacter sp. TaxID=1971739 RepID=UPI0032999EE8